jgi:hypothetical protein
VHSPTTRTGRGGSRAARAALAVVLGLVVTLGVPTLSPLGAPGAPGAPGVSGVPTASAAARWAPVEDAPIGPGVQMYTKRAQCTGNFVFRDRRGRVYVGYAAHCAGKGAATDTEDGCHSDSHPLGTRVRFARGGSLAGGGTTVGWGRLVYSSWTTMRTLGTTRENACAHNDFALVRVGPGHVKKVNPSVPFWGGPAALDTDGTVPGETVHSYGSSSLRGGVSALAPKQGYSLGTTRGGWNHPVYTLGPGVPGDSGSGFLDAEGRAFGVLSTLAIAPLTGSNGVGDLRRQLSFAQRHSGIPRLRLVRGTEPFRPLL